MGVLNQCTIRHVALLTQVNRGNYGYEFKFWHQWKTYPTRSVYGSTITLVVRDLNKFPCRMGYGKVFQFDI